ncbi:Long chain acyl-CoA synthetase 7, peroxisomal [Zancudomyces culisetae]|uniref:Long chain acyl-CoA synthetase 7, peroxisomal n=1 Tax=Zancudomyces culisetae TaxID=1213189 RepID=A0A1R1PG35_ZANCU|nr:Long chain acyl-CoA synthetase 7, peroxisomal [Zancudomyces culisetae]OMH79812.1 Long chain acyl-CoA synthetase 7, peroxisomal [Zancudomyces culisetae]|eukprot:OMH78746.1 Long chain acyl-CoA synthetase 7, peroxisomal [Zancudomyces culisetae]
MERHGENHKVFGYKPKIDDKGNFGPFKHFTYKEFQKRFRDFGSGLLLNGVHSGDFIGIFSKNCIEWIVTEYAGLNYDLISVPLYDTLGEEAMVHIINESDVKTVVCPGDKVPALVKIYEQVKHMLHTIVVIGELEQDLKEKAEQAGLKVLIFSEVEEQGAKNPNDYQTKATMDSIVTICYTSGTTGMPKGVVLTQKNFLCQIEGLSFIIEKKVVCNIGPEDSYLSVLPLAHVLERFIIHMLAYRGALICFSRGDITKMVDDIRELKPTIFVGVPRIFTRIRGRVISEIKKKGTIVSKMFEMGYNAKKENLRAGSQNHWLWDRLVFNKIREQLGGRIKLIVSGSAPISTEVLEFMKICFNCQVVEGYGLTETTGVTCLSFASDNDSGTVGGPFPTALVKLADVPDMNYLTTDKPYPRGEILLGGNPIASGYYKQPERTAEAFTSDGWFRTGDIGMIDDKGRVRIIDRKKNLFKLSQGEYVAPDKIENTYSDNPIVTASFVYGDSLKSYLVAVIVPEPPNLKKFLKERSISFDEDASVEQLCTESKIRKAVVAELNAFGRARGLKGFECIKNVHLEPKQFEVGEILTPAMKLKRHEAKVVYENVINELYAEIGDV